MQPSVSRLISSLTKPFLHHQTPLKTLVSHKISYRFSSSSISFLHKPLPVIIAASIQTSKPSRKLSTHCKASQTCEKVTEIVNIQDCQEKTPETSSTENDERSECNEVAEQLSSKRIRNKTKTNKRLKAKESVETISNQENVETISSQENVEATKCNKVSCQLSKVDKPSLKISESEGSRKMIKREDLKKDLVKQMVHDLSELQTAFLHPEIPVELLKAANKCIKTIQFSVEEYLEKDTKVETIDMLIEASSNEELQENATKCETLVTSSRKSKKVSPKKIIYHLEFDGACKGNPGKSGAGAVLRQGDLVVCRVSEGLGNATNNIAEYRALIRGLKAALDMGVAYIVVSGDSQLVCQQDSIYSTVTRLKAAVPYRDGASMKRLKIELLNVEDIDLMRTSRIETATAEAIPESDVQEVTIATMAEAVGVTQPEDKPAG